MKKKILGMLLLFLIALMTVSIASATISCSWTTPAATTVGTSSSYIRENVSMTVTCTGMVEGENITSAVISSSAGTITGALIWNSTLFTSNNTNVVNFTFYTNALNDVSTYTFTATVYNHSHGELATATRAFITDNSVPVTSALKDSDGTAISSGANKLDEDILTSTINNATSCEIYFDQTVFTGEMVLSSTTSGTATWDSNSEPSEQYYDDVYFKCSDGLNTTSATSIELNMGSESSSGGASATTVGGITIVESGGQTLAVIGGSETKAKAALFFHKEKQTKELVKTGSGALIGAGIGLIGGPLAVITVPVGFVVGAIVGVLI